ncbi:TetR/AcrR family transcriptional regulator [Nocardioides sp. Bht2]|uniref:TetR/AcrR family transcriptional regulator n=1 Tax=Nocardioides sp. Bht2 TaxID=3392297 RepID=UPI0039B3B5C3
MTAAVPRKYDNSRRQSRGRERILEAALELARSAGSWDWSDITFKVVAEAAEVSERTVYRHFPAQRDLHEAMMVRINEQAAISYDDLELAQVPDVVDKLFNSLATFTPSATAHGIPPAAVIAMDRERNRALRRASGGDVRLAAVLDILWSTDAYERLALSWRMSTQEAVDTIAWAMAELTDGAAVSGAPGTVEEADGVVVGDEADPEV